MFKNKRKLMRRKRDENESVRSAFGRGVGFYIGEPCESTCNRILFHVYCNKTTKRCECLEQYPVNIDNKACVKAARLGERCEHDNACAFYDAHSMCPTDESRCTCSDGYRVSDNDGSYCMPASTVKLLKQSDLLTLASVVGGLVVFTGLFCFALRLFTKGRFSRPADRMASAGSPPPSSILPTFGGSRLTERASRSSDSTDYLPGLSSRRASYSVIAPPSSIGSRRASSPSIRSQFSFHSHSSFRGYRYSRDQVRRTYSSPADSHHYPPSPCRATHHYHSHHSHQQPPSIREHTIHHNSPVDDDMTEDSPVPGDMNINQLSNHI